MTLLTKQRPRIELLDILRGIAICGIIYMNIYWVFGPTFEIQQADRELTSLFDVYFKTKFYTIFSFLFGLGAYIFIKNASLKYVRPHLLFIKRQIFLVLAGLMHVQLLPGEALSYYGFLGFFLLIAFKLKPKYNLMISILFMIFTGVIAATYFSILAMFFLGYFTGQIKFLTNVSKKRIWFIAIIIIFGSFAYYSNIVLVPKYYAHYYYSKILTLTGIAQSLSYISIICLLYSFGGYFRKVLLFFVPIGRMAFTNYIMQTVIMLFIVHYFQMKGVTHYGTTVEIASGILLFQLVYSHIYIKFYTIGPLEKLWRIWTYSPLWLGSKGAEYE